MKKIFLLIFSLSTVLFSCSDDITGLNEDTKNPTAVPADNLFTYAEKSIVDQMVSTNVNSNVFRLFVQQWTETTYTDESNYDVDTRSIPKNHFNTLYRDVIKNLTDSKNVLSKEVYTGSSTEIAAKEAARANKNQIIDIMIAYSYSVLVDTFGDIPYSQAIDLDNHPFPKYDDGMAIYKDLIVRLTAASTALNTANTSFGDADLIYHGDVAKWKKFANSLRLKLAINLDDTDHAYASTEALAAVTDGIITANIENTALKYLSAQPNTNPIYVDVVASERDDFVPTSTIIDQMNTLSDPRRPMFFTTKAGTTDFVGGTPGASNNFANFSHIGTKIIAPDFEGMLIDYAQVEFLLAEAVERGIAVGGTAATHYNNAVTASLSYWGVAPADITTYLAQPTVAYATATGTWKQKIGEQAYLALYNNGFECWTSYRRLDFPVLTAPADADPQSVPTRYTYPKSEQTLNKSNYDAAAIAIGGDDLTTKIFWDKN